MPFIDCNPSQWDRLLEIQAKPRTGLHVTDCLGCPRRRAGLAEGWTADLSRMEARLTGTITHRALAEVDPETAEIAVNGQLFGHAITGSIDRVEHRKEGRFTCDYKAGEDKGAGRNLPEAPYAEEVWQQECYRYLLGVPTVGWRIYYRWRKVWYVYQHVGPVWTEDKLGEFRPHGGAFTTRELAGQCVSGVAPASLPLVGATQKIGKGTACDWCEVQAACDAAGTEIEL